VGGAAIGCPGLFNDNRAHQRVNESDIAADIDNEARLNAGLQVSMGSGWIASCSADDGQYGLRGKRADKEHITRARWQASDSS
jgi:hypothetical protein